MSPVDVSPWGPGVVSSSFIRARTQVEERHPDLVIAASEEQVRGPDVAVTNACCVRTDQPDAHLRNRCRPA